MARSSCHGPGSSSLGVAAGLAITGLCLISAGTLGLGTRGELLGASAVSHGLRGVGGEAAHGQAKMMALCEGHFLDTATGIPETDYSTLSHPASMQGYQEPLPAEARAEIDAKYSVDPSKYQFKGCLSDDKVRPAKAAQNEGRREIAISYDFAKGETKAADAHDALLRQVHYHPLDGRYPGLASNLPAFAK